MHYVLFLLTTIYIFEANCDCNSTCFNKYSSVVNENKESIIQLFDNILDKYGRVDEHLQTLLKNLKEAQQKSDKDVNNFGKKVHKDGKIIKKIEVLLTNLRHNITLLQDRLKEFNFKVWPEKIQTSNESAHTLANTSFLDIDSILETIKYWDNFSNMLDNITESLTNLPHSVQDDIELINSLLDSNTSNISCLEDINKELKSLFAELITLLGFENSLEEIQNIKNISDIGRHNALEILDDSQELIKKYQEAEETRSLANETLNLAEELNDIKKTIDDLLSKYKDDLNSTFGKLMDDFEKEFQALMDKYDVGKYVHLLDKLEMLADEIETGGYGEFDMGEVQKEIEDDERTIDCYLEFIENCSSPKPVSPECQKIIDELQIKMNK